MRKFSLLLLALLSTIWPHAAGIAQQIEIPNLDRRITDQTGTLSRTELQSVEEKLSQFERETSTQLIVLMIPSLQGGSLEDLSLRVAEKNNIGRKGRNNGVLLLIAREDRQLRFEVGYGLEGALPDAVTSQIIRNRIVPHFRDGNYYDGILAGIDAVMEASRGEYSGDKNGDRRGRGFSAPITIALLIIFFLFRGFTRRRVVGSSGSSGGPWFWGGGGFGGGGSFGGGGGFSGGGGSFGGGGASGRW